MTDSKEWFERRLAEIEERERKATSPWALNERELVWMRRPPNGGEPTPIHICAAPKFWDKADMEFIHASRTDIPWLVARLRAAMAVVEKSRPVALRGHTPELGYALVAFDALAREDKDRA